MLVGSASNLGRHGARGVDNGLLELAEALKVEVNGGDGCNNDLCHGLFGGVSHGDSGACAHGYGGGDVYYGGGACFPVVKIKQSLLGILISAVIYTYDSNSVIVNVWPAW